MRQRIVSEMQAVEMIRSGSALLLAGEEAVLARLPRGRWIAGTIPYFVTREKGGMVSRDQVFVTDMTDIASRVDISWYDCDSLPDVYKDAPEHGFSFAVLPAGSRTHQCFALGAPGYESFGLRPLVGWVAGVHLEDLGQAAPKVFNGMTGESSGNALICMRVGLPPGRVAEIGIVNIFEQGDGDAIAFEEDGFQAEDVLVNGARRNFARYIQDNGLDTRLPLVADYYGAMINTSFQAVNPAEGRVSFYAPVFKGLTYRHAKPVPDYARRFQECLSQECDVDTDRIAFSCNCILNYLYSGLEGKGTGPFVGPITFGEIAYQLLNQTLVYLEIKSL